MRPAVACHKQPLPPHATKQTVEASLLLSCGCGAWQMGGVALCHEAARRVTGLTTSNPVSLALCPSALLH